MSGLWTWKGSLEEWARLQKAVEHNCACDIDNVSAPPCSAHKMLTNQGALDHLSYGRSIAKRLGTEEWRSLKRTG